MSRDAWVEAGIEYTAKDKASPVVAKTAKRFKKSTSRMATSAKMLKNAIGGMGKAMFSLKGAIGAFVAYQGTKMLINWMQESIRLAGIQTAAQVDFASALRAAGERDVQAAANEFFNFASALQQVTNYGDEAAIAAAAMGVRFGIPKEKIQEATTAAADFASGAGLELKNAMQMLGKAAAGQGSMLRRYGIEIDSTKSRAQQFEQALKVINEKFGGSAAAQAATYTGRINDLGNAYGDFREEVGFAVTESKTINAVIEVAIARVAALTAKLKEAKGGQDLLTGAFSKAMSAMKTIIKVGGFVMNMFRGLRVIGDAFGIALTGVFIGLVEAIRLPMRPLELLMDALVSLGVMEENPMQGWIDAFDGVQGAALDAAKAMAEDMEETGQAMVNTDGYVVSATKAIEDFEAEVVELSKTIEVNSETIRGNTKALEENNDAVSEAVSLADMLQAALMEEGIGVLDFEGKGESANETVKKLTNSMDALTASTKRSMDIVGTGLVGSTARAILAVRDLDRALAAGQITAEQYKETLREFGATAAQQAMQMGEQMGAMLYQVAKGQATIEEAMGNMARMFMANLVDMVTNSILAYAAQAAAAALAAHAYLPFVGAVVGAAAAATIAGLIKATIADVPKAATGGVITSGDRGKDSQAVLAQRGEGILKPGQTEMVQRLADSLEGGRRTPAGGGGGATHVTLNMQALDISEPETKKRMLLGLARELEELVDDNLLLPNMVRR